jgi:hypothetical protein
MPVPLVNLDAPTLQLIADAFDTLIELFGRECQVILDGVQQPCPNCTFDSYAGRSAGHYNGQGPMAFTRPPCPVCQGTGYDPTTAETVVVRKFTIQRDLNPNTIYPAGAMTRPVTMAKIKGYATDFPLIEQAKYIILDYANATYLNEKYIFSSEPSRRGNIVKGRYFVCYLERAK